MFFDTHCHIHERDYTLPVSDVLARARDAKVTQMICVGTSNESSVAAVRFAAQHEGVYASIGAHPHDATDGYTEVIRLAGEGHEKLVAIGEIGLDYFYDNSPRKVQINAFEAQLQLAQDHDLPVIFHVRDAYNDFWPIWRNFSGIRGVLHSFTDTQQTLEKALGEGLYIGVNGISTFAKDKQAVWDALPLESMLLETDAPFLTPVPHRGTINEPALVEAVAAHHAKRRGIDIDDIATATTTNARVLFGLN